ncbi:MAG: hypothetical protein GX364_09380 [Firmicutes bacterium]|jgi:hypothetical protein|nr:hypothetical protein [Bacillota bacterium]
MKPSKRILLLFFLTLAFFLFVGIGGLPAETMGDEPDEFLLFTSLGPTESPSADMICPSAISPKQSWVVEMNELLFTGKVKKGDRLIFDLPGEAAHSFSVDRINVDINGTSTIRGRPADDDFGYLLLTWDEGRALSSIRNYGEQREYTINYDPSRDRHLLHEVASRDADVIENGPPLIPPGEIGPQSVTPTLPEIDEEVTIDVMIVYTPAARDHAAESTGINTFIAQAMELGQLALDNSDVGVQLRLVHSAEVEYTEYKNGMGTSTDLARLKGKNDGYMDQVHAWRDQYGADLVNLFTLCEDVGGLGYMLTSETPRPESGFSISRVQQACSWTTLHEFGHNWGLHHSKEQGNAPGPGIYSYSAGWRWTGNDDELYASIMAYGEGVYEIVPHISNPDIWYQGARTGDKKNGDNARTTRQTKTIVAGYRPAVMELITSFSFPEQTGPAVIDAENRTVCIEVERGTDLAGLKAEFTLSEGATAYVNEIEQQSGETENDFSNPVIYTVKAEDGSTADWVVTVTENYIPVESLHLNVDRIIIREGETVELMATVEPGDASDRGVTWSSDEDGIAEVNETGEVSARSEGAATITACTVDGHFTAECEVLIIGRDWDLEESTEVQRIMPGEGGMATANFPALQALLRIETADHAGVAALTPFDSGHLDLPPALLPIGSYIVPEISDNVNYTAVELGMSYVLQELPETAVESELRLFADNDRSGIWQEVPDQHIDTGKRTITARLEGLSPLAIFDEVLFGDANLDGKVDVADAITILQAIVGLLDLSPAGMKRADVSTGDASFPNVADAILVLQKIVGLIGDFPVGLNQ